MSNLSTINICIFAATEILGGVLLGCLLDNYVAPALYEFQAAMPPLSPEWSAIASNTIDNMQIAVDMMPESTIFRILGVIIGMGSGIITLVHHKM